MASRLLTFAVWLLVAASALFWGFRVFVGTPGLPAQVQMPARSLAQGGPLDKVLGSTAVAAADVQEDSPEADRFHLLGVVAPSMAAYSPQGLALIAVGDERPRTVRTGAVIDGDTVLLSVAKRSVSIGPRGGPATAELSLPEAQPSRAPVAGAPAFRLPAPALPPPGMVRPLQPGQEGAPVQPLRQPGPADAEADDE
jgi:general secretion pathway protein C